MARVASRLGSVVRKIRFIGFFPLTQTAVVDKFQRLQKRCRFTRLSSLCELKIEYLCRCAIFRQVTAQQCVDVFAELRAAPLPLSRNGSGAYSSLSFATG
jgi:hypothetical protein